LYVSELFARHLGDTKISLKHKAIKYGYVLKKFWFPLPEDGEIISPKHAESMKKIVRINDRISCWRFASP